MLIIARCLWREKLYDRVHVTWPINFSTFLQTFFPSQRKKFFGWRKARPVRALVLSIAISLLSHDISSKVTIKDIAVQFRTFFTFLLKGRLIASLFLNSLNWNQKQKKVAAHKSGQLHKIKICCFY